MVNQVLIHQALLCDLHVTLLWALHPFRTP